MLYYITHIGNIESILKFGILSHNEITKRGISYKHIYNPEIVEARQEIEIDGRSLCDFANVYFTPRNAMLFRVIHELELNEIAVLGINPGILERPDIFVSDGNARAVETKILPKSEAEKMLLQIRKEANKTWWFAADGSKRKLMAECLVPGEIPPSDIISIYVASAEVKDKLQQQLSDCEPIIAQPDMFFLSALRNSIPSNISIFEGDMFFSNMQTLTISVNCVGIMGKGLASRAKYQFPDVYVYYQDLCRSRRLKLGLPCLISVKNPWNIHLHMTQEL